MVCLTDHCTITVGCFPPEYKKKIGFSGQLLIEPKPKEPMKHQYDYGKREGEVRERGLNTYTSLHPDAQTVISFLKSYGLDNDFKVTAIVEGGR